ncbi:MAG TPA: lipopolysaccharide heptosyltransferase I [Candidatus Nitrosotenuis sp.]|jgi:heptosyltransferase-1|nr:lipopolysaccharide heptosyltransferase I [Candidatus Nitrosotenuis sp.]
MRILLIKTSSLGDIVHTFPAVSDAAAHIDNLSVDWVVEETFVTIPPLHPAVHRTIPVALRRWRKNPFSLSTYRQVYQFIHHLRQTPYDAIIDAQGLIKSAILARLARGPSWGYDQNSAREKIASYNYHHKIPVVQTLDALTRTRQLLASSLGYPLPNSLPVSGLTSAHQPPSNWFLFLPGTTWENKKWPIVYWQHLAQIMGEHGATIHIPWSNELEYQIAQNVQAIGRHIHILPKMDLAELVSQIPHYQGVVAVDSGLGYLAAAYGVPTVMMFGPTTPDLLGTFPKVQINLSSKLWCAPCRTRQCHNTDPSPVWPACFEEITPMHVWQTLQMLVPSAF